MRSIRNNIHNISVGELFQFKRKQFLFRLFCVLAKLLPRSFNLLSLSLIFCECVPLIQIINFEICVKACRFSNAVCPIYNLLVQHFQRVFSLVAVLHVLHISQTKRARKRLNRKAVKSSVISSLYLSLSFTLALILRIVFSFIRSNQI